MFWKAGSMVKVLWILTQKRGYRQPLNLVILQCGNAIRMRVKAWTVIRKTERSIMQQFISTNTGAAQVELFYSSSECQVCFVHWYSFRHQVLACQHCGEWIWRLEKKPAFLLCLLSGKGCISATGIFVPNSMTFFLIAFILCGTVVWVLSLKKQ